MQDSIENTGLEITQEIDKFFHEKIQGVFNYNLIGMLEQALRTFMCLLASYASITIKTGFMTKEEIIEQIIAQLEKALEHKVELDENNQEIKDTSSENKYEI